MGLHSEPWIDAVLGGDAMRESSTVVNGLRFYTPDIINDEACTAYERAEAIAGDLTLTVVPPGQAGVFVLTPSGEHGLADLDVSGLEQIERDTKRLRERRR